MPATAAPSEILWTAAVALTIAATLILLTRSVRQLLFLRRRRINGSRLLLARGRCRRGALYLVLSLACLWIGVRAMLDLGGSEVLVVLVLIPITIGAEAWLEVLDNALLDRLEARRDRRAGDRTPR